ncbi:class I SAM-dependent methyltransferase [bacterium]|nr:class I SAM-dependent methyltransferase [bacterium]
MKKSSAQSKFRLYEEFVQSPKWQVEYLPQFHTWLSGKEPLRFREDFCGSARVACEWVMLSKKHTALGVDLDPRVLEYARSVNRSALTPDQQSRISLLRSDVRKPTRARFDWIGAFNFSIFEFHERDELLQPHVDQCL